MRTDQKEALELLQNTAVKAKGVTVLPNDKRPSKLMLFVHDTNEIKELDVEPAPLNRQLHSLPDFINVAVDHKAEAGEKYDGSIWHSNSKVVYSYDDARRRDYAGFTLVIDPRYAKLLALSGSPVKCDQVTFLKLLKFDLAGTLPDENLIALLAKVKFSSSSEAGAEVTHGKESISRAVKRDISNTTDLPEQINLRVPVYQNFPSGDHPIRCALNVHLEEEKFSLVPLPGEMQTAMDAAQAVLRATINEYLIQASKETADAGDIKVYYGTP